MESGSLADLVRRQAVPMGAGAGLALGALGAFVLMLASGVVYGHELDEPLSWEPRAAQRYADAEYEARKARKGSWPEMASGGLTLIQAWVGF
mgnify:CR=1 FL=1